MRAAFLVLILLAGCVPVGQGLPGTIEVGARAVGFDDATDYVPSLRTYPGSSILLPAVPPCITDQPAANPPCVALPPATQWYWIVVSVHADGIPVEGRLVRLVSSYRAIEDQTNERGEVSLLVPGVEPLEAIQAQAFVSNAAGNDFEWEGGFQWFAGAPLANATVSTFFAPDEGWANYTLSVVEPGYLEVWVSDGLEDSSAPYDDLAAILAATFRLADGRWLGTGTAFAGHKEPIAHVRTSSPAALDLRLSVYDPVAFDATTLVAVFSGYVTPGALTVETTIGRAGLEGDHELGLHVFGAPATYALTPGALGGFRVAPAEFEGVSARAVIWGPHTGTYTTSLNVDYHSQSLVMLGAGARQFSIGEVEIAHDRASSRRSLDPTSNAPTFVSSLSQGDCYGNWQATTKLDAGVASGIIGAAIAEGLTLPDWWMASAAAPLPCR